MVANEETFDENNSSDSNNYKEQYKEMKRKLRLLIYENEIFQQTLKNTQRKLLKASRDKNLLLDRLIQYERVELTSSDDELTESSDDAECAKPEPKKRKEAPTNSSSGGTGKQSISPQTVPNPAKKRKPSAPKSSKVTTTSVQPNGPHPENTISIPESSKSFVDSKPGNNNFSQHHLPTDMFNDNFSVKSESNSMYDMDTSPNHVAEDMISVDSIIK